MPNRPATMPPRLASRLTPGFNVLQPYVRAKVRSRQIAKGTYRPYERLFAFLRQHAGTTSMREIARRAELPYAKVSRWLRGISEPAFCFGMKMARAIGCTPEQFNVYLDDAQRHPMRVERLAMQQAKAARATSWKQGLTQEIASPQSATSAERRASRASASDE